jgi:hypothetical protein
MHEPYISSQAQAQTLRHDEKFHDLGGLSPRARGPREKEHVFKTLNALFSKILSFKIHFNYHVV